MIIRPEKGHEKPWRIGKDNDQLSWCSESGTDKNLCRQLTRVIRTSSEPWWSVSITIIQLERCSARGCRNYEELGVYQLIMIIYVMTQQVVFSDGDLALCCDLQWAEQRAERRSMKGRQMYTLPRQGSGESGSGYSVRSDDLRSVSTWICSS